MTSLVYHYYVLGENILEGKKRYIKQNYNDFLQLGPEKKTFCRENVIWKKRCIESPKYKEI